MAANENYELSPLNSLQSMKKNLMPKSPLGSLFATANPIFFETEVLLSRFFFPPKNINAFVMATATE